MRRSIKLGGVTFVSVKESTAEHDDLFEVARGKAGLGTLEMQPGEAAAFTRRVFDQVSSRGSTNALLSYLIVPKRRTWSPAVAAETARLLGELTDPKEKALRRQLLAEMLGRFFLGRLISVVSSRRSSDTDLHIESSDDASSAPMIAGGAGGTLSEPSPATTTAARDVSHGGPSASY